MDGPSGSGERGDLALRAVLRAHGLAMNGGLFHAAENLSTEERSKAQDGYQFLGLAAVAGLFQRACLLFDAGEDLENHEAKLDAEYFGLADDSVLYERFEQHLSSHPSDFSPI